jgi:hypothetical protein
MPEAADASSAERAVERLLEQVRKGPRAATLDDTLVSVVIPVVDGSFDDRPYGTALDTLPVKTELVVMRAEPQWGAAVRAGLREARGDILCYAHPRRTSPATLRTVLAYALAYPDTVIRANRRTRDSLPRKLGSLMFNLECRLLYGLPVWDVNGSPKVFPRSFDALLDLRRDDDLIDLEFAVRCQKEGYPVVEVPIYEQASDPERIGPLAALRLYARAYSRRRELGRC